MCSCAKIPEYTKSENVNKFAFYLGGQSVSCTASLAALWLYGYFCDFCFVFVSENEYDDDDDH